MSGGALKQLPAGVWLLASLYFAASLAHFVHNGAYIALYPAMPSWITSPTVYAAWLGVTSVGVVGLVAIRIGFVAAGLLLLGCYGALGLDGLGHYALALCSEHTLGANLTIWAEVISGLALLLVSSVLAYRRVMRVRTSEP